MEFLPAAIGVTAITIVLLLPQVRRLTGNYAHSLSGVELYSRIILDAQAGGSLGAALSSIFSYSMLDRYSSLPVGQSEFTNLVISFLFGWLIAVPAGGIVISIFLRRRVVMRMPVIVASVGYICACCPPLAYTAGVVFFTTLPR
jgi:hypothetical protein